MLEEFDRVTLDGFSLAVQTGGPAGAPPLLLLQGQANSHRWWNELRTAFEVEFRTVTFDYRGTGRSRGPIERWTTTSFAADVVEVLDWLGVDAVSVYGTSMGGRVAQMLATNHPARVAALVLASTSPGGPHAVEPSPNVRRALARATPEQRLYLLQDLFYTPAWPHPPQDGLLFGDPSMSPPEAAAHLRASDQHDAWDVLTSIEGPALVLHGADDRMTPVVNAELLAGRIPGARLEVHPTGRHGFFDEYADHINATVLAFLTEHHDW